MIICLMLRSLRRFYPFDESGIPFACTTVVIKETTSQLNGEEDGGTGLNVWDGSLLLARYLEKRPAIVRNKTVLELGSGCGLIGVASGILGAKLVTMTDLQYTLPSMKENVERNKSSWQGEDSHCQIECKECDWFHPPPITELCDDSTDSPDVILVADCVWLAHLIAPLLQTLNKYTTNASTKVIITYQQRGRDAHKEFLEGIHDLFDVVVVDTEKDAGLIKPDVFHVFECSKKSST
mmetsp:Transcript_23948/g.51714  ORF Transcript_23948/g.51714 Transcript_23948/m.51714 type:complete len:237 (-) Transcript_23948:99-809(-)